MRSILPSFVLAASCFGESVTLRPSQDSDVYSFFDGPSFSIFDLNVGAGGAMMVHSHHSLLRFNLASLAIPAAEIGSARLRLFALQPASSNGGGLRGGNVAVHRQGSNWAVTGLRWRDLQAQERIGLIAINQASVNNWVELDVTPLVKSWAAGTTANHGFILRPESETLEPWLNVQFASMEIANFAPQLVITRQEVVPTLGITTAGGQIVLEWPAGLTGWTLQEAASPAGPWLANNSPTTSVNGFRRVHHTPEAGASRFFRLFKP
jgi:hypothetical protein